MFDDMGATKIAKSISLYFGSTVGGVASLSLQLQTRHQYMHLELPLWVFLTLTIILIFTGAAFSLRTDTLRGGSSRAEKYLTACAMGLIVTFLVLPVVVAKPNPLWIMLTGAISSFSGTILLYLLTRVLQDKALHEALVKITTDALRDGIVGFVERIRAVWDAIHGRGK